MRMIKELSVEVDGIDYDFTATVDVFVDSYYNSDLDGNRGMKHVDVEIVSLEFDDDTVCQENYDHIEEEATKAVLEYEWSSMDYEDQFDDDSLFADDFI